MRYYHLTRIRLYFFLWMPERNETIKPRLVTVIVVLQNIHAHPARTHKSRLSFILLCMPMLVNGDENYILDKETIFNVISFSFQWSCL
jgi:hypothetical protein